MSTPKRSFRARKRFGQHFLAAKWAEKVVRTIDPQPGDIFLEIGPGQGALTFPLAKTGAPILAVELDRDLLAELAPRVPPNVSLMSGDILRTDVLPFLTGLQPQNLPGTATTAPRRYRIVGNLPYNLSTPILFKLLEWQAQTGMFSDATVMLQREVADRLAAKPGTKAWGALSLYLQLDTHINVPLRLPPGAFNPPPKVHSAIAHLTFQPRTVRISDQDIFDRLVRTMFSLRRKTLNNVLKSYDPAAPAVLGILGIDGMRRPETLSLAELGRLVEGLASAKRSTVL